MDTMLHKLFVQKPVGLVRESLRLFNKNKMNWFNIVVISLCSYHSPFMQPFVPKLNQLEIHGYKILKT